MAFAANTVAVWAGLAFVALSSFASIFLLHASYHTYAFDLGLFAQSLQSTLEGHLLYHTMGGLSHLAYHFSPILLALVPAYWVVPRCETLLVIQAVALGSAGYLVFALSRSRALEYTDWCRVGLRFLVSGLLGYPPLEDARILDVGMGTGGNLGVLHRHGTVIGLDSSRETLRYAISRGSFNLVLGDVKEHCFKSTSADIVTTLDVLEHVDEVELRARPAQR